MNRVVLAALAISTIAFAGSARAQDIDFSKVEIKTIDLGHNTYRLEGQGGNITVAVGTDGIIMVDGQFAPLHDKIKAAIAAISPLPVRLRGRTPDQVKQACDPQQQTREECARTLDK